MPCWICDKDLILGEAITTFGDNSHKSPAHLDCVKTQAISEFKEKLKERVLKDNQFNYRTAQNLNEAIEKTAQEITI